MPLLQGGVGDFPGAVKPLFQRSYDVVYVRWDDHSLLSASSPCNLR